MNKIKQITFNKENLMKVLLGLSFGLFTLIILPASPALAQSNGITVGLVASPNSGNAPLNSVSLTASVYGDVSGPITYKFDCQGDGYWDYTFSNISDNPKTVSNACSYYNAGNYTAKVYVERGTASPVIAAVQISAVGQPTSGYVAPMVQLTANGSQNSVNVTPGSAVTLNWTSSNVGLCYASGGWTGSKGTSGSETIGSVNSFKSYTLTCTGQGGTAIASVTVYVTTQTSPTTYSFPSVQMMANGISNSITVNYNTPAILSWNSSNANSCYASGDWSGYKSTSGSRSTGNLTSTKTYTLSCYGPAGYNSDTVTISVTGQPSNLPSASLQANGFSGFVTIDYNTSANLTWTSTNVNACYASGNWTGSKGISGSESTGNLNSARTYILTCSGPAGSVVSRMTVNVSNPVSRSPIIDLKINGFSNSVNINYNDTANLSWTSSNVDTCYASGGWSGTKNISGSETTDKITSNQTYTLTCYGPGGYSSRNVTAYITGSVYNSSSAYNYNYPIIVNSIPIVDLKLNGLDGYITLNPNNSVKLSWTSLNANSCYASGDWSGYKASFGSEIIGNITSAKTYTLTCTGTGGSKSDAVTVNISSNYSSYQSSYQLPYQPSYQPTSYQYSSQPQTSYTAGAANVVLASAPINTAATKVSTGITNKLTDYILLPLIVALILTFIFRNQIIFLLSKWEQSNTETFKGLSQKRLEKTVMKMRSKGVLKR